MPPTSTPRSRGGGGRRPRPASAAALSFKTTDSPRARRRPTDNQQDGALQHAEVARLADHMDSFPLVPLPVIPQLGIADLEKVERGLNELLGSLMPHESDQQLGRYATRQLSLVQRQLMQQRAQERVFQMLRGDVPATLAPIEAASLRKSSSAAAVVKIGSPSVSSPATASDNQKNSQYGAPQCQLRGSSGAADLHWKSKKAGVEMARAMVQANATKKNAVVCSTGFVISAGGNASRKRGRQRVPKRTPEDEARYQALQLEREREKRRQAAYQRLQARRELQAKRKQQHERQEQELHKDPVRDAGGNSAEREEKQQNTSESECESETSDVSNCSESDEANEKAILALEVEIPSPADHDDESPRSDSDEDVDVDVDGGVHKEDEEIRGSDSRIEDGQPEVASSLGMSNSSSQSVVVIEGNGPTNASIQQPHTPIDKHAEENSDDSLRTKRRDVDLCDTRGSELADPNDLPPDEKTPSWIDEVRQSAEESRARSPEIAQARRTLSLPRAPVTECKDYRFYFSNFQCILTSVFEQCRSSSANTSSATSLYHRPVGTTGEHTMRLQQKLYESWQSIMQDYATVFGPKIVAPEGMVPLAAAKPWAPHYRINSTARKEVSEIVTQALQRLGGGWEEHPSGLGLKTTWNLLWTWSKPRVERQTLLAWQKVNHFQHAKALTRKDCLKKHIGKYLAAGGRLRQAFDIIPPTFLLPKEYVAFVQAFQERSERLRRSGLPETKNIWIMKPVALSRGRGISLVNDLSQVIYGEQVVIQEYIAAPRLLDGFKFDLRLIQKDNEEAIAGSANPIASAMKEERGATLASLNSHVNQEGEATQKDAGGTKTTLAYLWRRLAADGVDVEQVKRSIEEVVLKALVCGEDQIPFQVNSFDLLGYDILLDADLRPWLIEINSSPSMARDNDLDYQVKDAMMLDTLRVVDPLHFDRAKLAEIIARRQRDLEDEKRRPHAHTRHPREAEELAARQLNEDLTTILRGKVPRAYGEIPENIGNYRRLCPHTTVYNQLVKLKRSCLRVGDRKT
ncbi:tubulin-tyrosine ligase family [Phytophthora cinnamomi]|uniref:tubulin-tyrosine ligase family n=1 Tax=Phytophthora cinnamomi TaxID=4785 RepID=UPI003559D6FA|nr:tubulin-tyrosine ligase family [Phytophthora cinnamomi]